MGHELSFDDRGRVTIPRPFRDRLGDRVVAILMPHGVVLRPVPGHVDMAEPASQVSGDEAARSEVANDEAT